MNEIITNKLSQFAECIVSHPEYTQALECIYRSVETTQVRGEPASALIVGEPGTGKSTVCKVAMSRFGDRKTITDEHGTREVVPTFYCSLNAGATIKTLTVSMLQQLGSTNYSGNNSTLFNRLVTLLKTCQTQLIVLDEFDNLLRKGAEKSREQVCDWVRTLLNETLVPVAIVGIPRCEEIINAHPQLSRRYPYRHQMTEFTYSTLDPKSTFSKTLRVLGNALKEIGEFESCMNFCADQHLKAMYLATGGNMNGIRQLLSDALKVALLRGDGCFNDEDLAKAVDLSFIPTAKCPKNPFRLTTASLDRIISGRMSQ
ncbi:TniB family NTP-binding protein [Pseudomonas sp. LFM046]|uniref:TniB family NTP-binding protein n=1 Tax=Pseudomonas sp. LFM046 TaxID=1608357 RepID=UPI0005CFEC51|nr:TniB family NTP-binding protein [Pseudomonas sp. LFM046]